MTALPGHGELVHHLEQAGRSFKKGELAYLALTSNPGDPIRDRVAWSLQHALAPEILVGRGWRRRGLVLLGAAEPARPLVVVDFKAGIANEAGLSDKLLAWLAHDREQCRELDLAGAAVYRVVLATRVSTGIPQSLRAVVRSLSSHDREVSDTDLAQAYQGLATRLRRYGELSQGSIPGGEVFDGINVALDYWVVGPARH